MYLSIDGLTAAFVLFAVLFSLSVALRNPKRATYGEMVRMAFLIKVALGAVAAMIVLLILDLVVL